MSKWNKIEHKIFSYITINRRGKCLKSCDTIIELIGNIKTNNGLSVSAEIDKGMYEAGKKIRNEYLDKINLIKYELHKDLNYRITYHRQ